MTDRERLISLGIIVPADVRHRRWLESQPTLRLFPGEQARFELEAKQGPVRPEVPRVRIIAWSN